MQHIFTELTHLCTSSLGLLISAEVILGKVCFFFSFPEFPFQSIYFSESSCGPAAEHSQSGLPASSSGCSYRPDGKITLLDLNVSRDLDFSPYSPTNFQCGPRQ